MTKQDAIQIVKTEISKMISSIPNAPVSVVLRSMIFSTCGYKFEENTNCFTLVCLLEEQFPEKETLWKVLKTVLTEESWVDET